MSAMEVVAECPSFFITNNKLCLCLPMSAYSLIVLSCYSTSLKPEYSSAFVRGHVTMQSLFSQEG